MKMNIIHAIYSFQTGGAETMLIDIINEQCQSNSVTLIVINDKINENLLSSINKKIKIILLKRKPGNKISLIKTFFRLNKIIALLQPDIIHCHDNNLFPFFIRWKNRTVITIHNVNRSKAFLGNYKKIFAISDAVKKDIKSRTNLKAKIVYNGIHVDEYLPRTEYDFDFPSEFGIVLLGRLFLQQKGHDIAIEALSHVLKKHKNSNIQLYFIGSGEDENKLHKLTDFFDLTNNVHFLGLRSRSWVKENLKNFMLLIQPSRYEGFGLTVLEGISCGLPVIVSNLDGPKEILENLNTGLFVAPNNPRDLADKINIIIDSYINNSIEKSSYILKDRESLKKFDIKNTANNYIEEYKKILNFT